MSHRQWVITREYMVVNHWRFVGGESSVVSHGLRDLADTCSTHTHTWRRIESTQLTTGHRLYCYLNGSTSGRSWPLSTARRCARSWPQSYNSRSQPSHNSHLNTFEYSRIQSYAIWTIFLATRISKITFLTLINYTSIQYIYVIVYSF